MGGKLTTRRPGRLDPQASPTPPSSPQGVPPRHRAPVRAEGAEHMLLGSIRIIRLKRPGRKSQVVLPSEVNFMRFTIKPQPGEDLSVWNVGAGLHDAN